MKHYGIMNFLFDLLMIGLTGGLWLVWIVLSFFRKNS